MGARPSSDIPNLLNHHTLHEEQQKYQIRLAITHIRTNTHSAVCEGASGKGKTGSVGALESS